MKKLIVSLILIVVFFISGCGNDKVINNKTYGTYGLFNQNEMKNEKIEYQLILGNLIWSFLLCETIVAPIYFIGFSIYEPVGIKNVNKEKGEI